MFPFLEMKTNVIALSFSVREETIILLIINIIQFKDSADNL